MSAGGANRETEIKLQLPGGAAEGRRLLRRAGFRIRKRRSFETNIVLDFPDRRLRAAGSLLRLRRCCGAALLTFKGPAERSRHKTREEIEVQLREPDACEQILARLNLAPVFRYEKYRTEYAQAARPGLVTLDETPVGDFLELEGAPEWIDETAALLGFSTADYVTASYARLYMEFRAMHPASPEDMVFE